MRTVEICTENFSDIREIHEYLSEKLSFPSYYGKNFSALYDVLTESSEETRIVLNITGREPEKLKGSITILERVLLDAKEANPHFDAVIKKK